MIRNYQTSQIVYLDECGFNLHATQYYGYSLKNKKSFVTVPANKFNNISLLCCISENGIVGFELKEGAFDSISFMSFVEIILFPYFLTKNDCILVIDNARFHHTADVRNLFSEMAYLLHF